MIELQLLNLPGPYKTRVPIRGAVDSAGNAYVSDDGVCVRSRVRKDCAQSSSRARK